MANVDRQAARHCRAAENGGEAWTDGEKGVRLSHTDAHSHTLLLLHCYADTAPAAWLLEEDGYDMVSFPSLFPELCIYAQVLPYQEKTVRSAHC